MAMSAGAASSGGVGEVAASDTTRKNKNRIEEVNKPTGAGAGTRGDRLRAAFGSAARRKAQQRGEGGAKKEKDGGVGGVDGGVKQSNEWSFDVGGTVTTSDPQFLWSSVSPSLGSGGGGGAGRAYPPYHHHHGTTAAGGATTTIAGAAKSLVTNYAPKTTKPIMTNYRPPIAPRITTYSAVPVRPPVAVPKPIPFPSRGQKAAPPLPPPANQAPESPEEGELEEGEIL